MERFVRVATLAVCLFFACGADGHRWRRQADENAKKDDSLEQELCKDKDAGEWFRLVAEEDDNCRDVIQCTASGFQVIRCPTGLYFDIEKQTCDWKDAVKNCKLKNKARKVKPLPLLYTEEPICPDGLLACGDAYCIERSLFCNGEIDCADGSDENSCDIDNDPNRAPPCDQSQCVLPDCFCSEDGTMIPGNLPARDIPQMITITFDDAINNNNIELYQKIFNGKRKNPNGCDIKATYFISHKYTNYSAVQEIHRKGHEIAVHSITHNNDERFWSNANVDDWRKEMAGMRTIIETFSNITDNSVVGVRVPYLRVGGNNQFTMMEEQNFLYDSTITAPLSNPPLWPYTMNFRMPHPCHGNCPTRSHAVWEMVMNKLDHRKDPTKDEYLPGCAMIDSCSNIVKDYQFYDFLHHNFDRHYSQNRAPLGLSFRADWLKDNPDLLEALLYWIDEKIQSHNDVYFVTMTQVVQWMQDPQTISEAKNFEPWREKCSVEGVQACWVPHSCKLTSKKVSGETINLQTCMRCPSNYPWLNDPTGEGHH